MADMIERVAKRLWDDSFDRMPEPPWEETTELQKRFNRMLARSAIEAMREPTREMLLAGDNYDLDVTSEGASQIWQDMIEAALAPATTGRPT